jgi:hypothetical protein
MILFPERKTPIPDARYQKYLKSLSKKKTNVSRLIAKNLVLGDGMKRHRNNAKVVVRHSALQIG